MDGYERRSDAGRQRRIDGIAYRPAIGRMKILDAIAAPGGIDVGIARHHRAVR